MSIVQNTDNKKIDIAKRHQKSEILNDLKSISDTIKQENKLKEIWDIYYET